MRTDALIVEPVYPHERTGIVLCDGDCVLCDCDRCELEDNENDPIKEGFRFVEQDD